MRTLAPSRHHGPGNGMQSLCRNVLPLSDKGRINQHTQKFGQQGLMMRVGEYTIEPAAFDAFPESVAREDCLLPLGFMDGRLRILAGRRDDKLLNAALQRAANITALPLRYAVIDWGDVARLVDELYSGQFTSVANCLPEFQIQCPRQWLELLPTDAIGIRRCDVCERQVFWAATPEEAEMHARAGRCIALSTDGIEVSVGMLRLPDDQA
jgi:hypothetical protein